MPPLVEYLADCFLGVKAGVAEPPVIKGAKRFALLVEKQVDPYPAFSPEDGQVFFPDPAGLANHLVQILQVRRYIECFFQFDY